MKRMVQRSRTHKSVIAGVLAASAVSASFWATNAWGFNAEDDASTPPGFSKAAEVKAEYGDVFASFGSELPDDVELPAMSDRIQAADDRAGGSAIFEDGYAESEMITIWRCGWERSYLNAAKTDNAEAQGEAAKKLATYYDLPAVKKWVSDPGHAWYGDVIEPALKGDLDPLEEDLTVNCGAPFAP